MGTTSIITLSNVIGAQAQNQAPPVQIAQMAEAVPEQVLVTGSLIHGAAVVGVPVLNLSVQDATTAGVLTIGDLFRDVPAVVTATGSDALNTGGHLVRANPYDLHNLDAGLGERSLMMIDGVRFPTQGDHLNVHDPSIIPVLALDRVDVLADGASATYGSDAISGVVNIILKRGYDGAVTQLGVTATDGRQDYRAAQLWGRTWESGDITLSYEWYDESPLKGTVHSKFTTNFQPWGLDNETPLGVSLPGTISVGTPANTANAFKATLGSNCTNCFAIPQGAGGNFDPSLNNGLGPLTPSSGPGLLNWSTFAVAANGGSNGTRNEFDPNLLAWESGKQQRNGATITVDQNLTSWVSFYGEGFYSDRRAEEITASNEKPVSTLVLSSIAIPTTNPYYPIGAPSGLRVNYDLGYEIPGYVAGSEVASRYRFGLNLDLPATWHGDVYYSRSTDANKVTDNSAPNVAAVSAALGWTIPAAGAAGTTPGIGTWTKPATVPYLNLLCDPRQFQCNSPTTLNYLMEVMDEDERYIITEEGVNFDGPLVDLPGGKMRAAVGGNYRSDNFSNVLLANSGTPSLVLTPVTAYNPFTVWAAFAQLNIPVFGEGFNFPLAKKLDLELSWRHDSYSGDLNGSTSNPKVAFTWLVDENAGFSLKGSWNTSFRMPSQAEYSNTYVETISSYNLPANLSTGGTALVVPCGPNNAPPAAGSGAAKLYATFGAASCNQGYGGIEASGGPLPSLRPNGFNGGPNLGPEKSKNYVLGAEFAPSAFLKGLDIEGTWYSVKIDDTLGSFPASQAAFGIAGQGFAYIVPSDLANLPGGAGCANANANPAQCPLFEQLVQSVLSNPRNSAAQLAALTDIYWVNDGGQFNKGSLKAQGVDWNGSYEMDLGDLGAWNTGITGTYYLHYMLSVPGTATVDGYHFNSSAIGGLAVNGIETAPRMYYRGRLGWSDGPWSVIGFVDYVSHYFSSQASPPDVNFQCLSAGGSTPGGTFPCAISNYTGLAPSQYLFDLSLGYDTGENPANSYLKHLVINLVVNNIFDRSPPFQYGVGAHTLTAYDQMKTDQGRTFTLTLTKTW
jgi:iron complex outermembrane receptor protein